MVIADNAVHYYYYYNNHFTALWTVRDNPGEPVQEDIFTHSHLSWS